MTFTDIIQNCPSEVAAVTRSLRDMILRTDKHIEENIYGGSKMRMALYSIGNANNVLYGLQASGSHCMLFLHHADKVDTGTLKLDGRGKYARHMKISSLDSGTIRQLKHILKDILTAAKA